MKIDVRCNAGEREAVPNKEIQMLTTPEQKIPTCSPNQIAEKQLGSQMPTHEQIAARAHEIFLAGGSQSGRCEQNWTEAETELRQQAAAPGGLDKAYSPASIEMISEGAGGAIDDSANRQNEATRRSQPFDRSEKLAATGSINKARSSVHRGL